MKFNSLKDLLYDLNKNIDNLSIYKYDDLDEKEEKVLKEIAKYQNELIKEGRKTLNGPNRPYIITKILKY